MDKIKSALNQGISIVELECWGDFESNAKSLKSKRGFFWRGQRQDWPLLSSFDRRVGPLSEQERTERLQQHLNNFKVKMDMSHPQLLPTSDDLDIWAIGQHYGLKTPLLDWSRSYFIAAYFAFIEQDASMDDGYRYIYAVNKSAERLLLKWKKAGSAIRSERALPFIETMPYNNPRLERQQGIFTKAQLGDDAVTYIKKFAADKPDEIIFVKFKIPSREREKCLAELNAKEINHTQLLLDLRHVVDECNKLLCKKRLGRRECGLKAVTP